MQSIQKLPMVALRGLVVFPYMVLHFDIGREKSVQALERSMALGKDIFLSAQKDISVENPSLDDIYSVGTVAKIKQVLKLPGDTIRVLAEGLYRGKVRKLLRESPYLEVEIEAYDNHEPPRAEDIIKEAYMRKISDMFSLFSRMSTQISSETLMMITSLEKPGEFADVVAANVIVKMDDRQKVLECVDELQRLKMLAEIFSHEIEILKIDKEIDSSVRMQIDKSQKEYFSIIYHLLKNHIYYKIFNLLIILSSIII